MSDQPRKSRPLLDELQELQNVLGDAPSAADIPVLDDIIEPSPKQCEHQATGETTASPQVLHAGDADNDHSRDIFLQELIDDMLPDIEAELRRRLLKIDRELLERWHQQSRSR